MLEIVIDREFYITRYAKSQGRKSHSKGQDCQSKILHKKDTHVHNNFYELQSRAIKRTGQRFREINVVASFEL